MPLEIITRRVWHGQAEKMADFIRMYKTVDGRPRKAVGELWSHQLGWEIRLFLDGEWYRTKVCRTQDDVLDTTDEWTDALKAKGTLTPPDASSTA